MSSEDAVQRGQGLPVGLVDKKPNYEKIAVSPPTIKQRRPAIDFGDDSDDKLALMSQVPL
jgi:hypothetical protein